LETSSPDFSIRDVLALLALVLPEAFSFPCPEPRRLDCSHSFERLQPDPAAFHLRFRRLRAVLGFYLSGTSEKAPFWVLLPVLQSFKEPGSWLVSYETAGL